MSSICWTPALTASLLLAVPLVAQLDVERAVPPADATPSPATVLLITSTELRDAWQPFADWKTRIGKPTRILAIPDDYDPSSIQEELRLAVRDHIDHHGTRWVILGGDSLPGGKGIVPGGHTTVHRQERRGIPTDIVYLSPTNWDADDDGTFGEWPDDQDAITYPDGSVGLGRVPVRTAADVAAFTAKVIDYETNYPTDAFAQHMVYTCTDSPAYPKVRNSWDGYVSKVWDGEVERFFAHETPWDGDEPGSHQLSTDNLLSLINGRTTGKLHIHGHGMLPFWVLEGTKFTASDVARLDNASAYPLITTVSCFTGQYDSEKDPSIVESMIRHPIGGSVAVVAPVRSGKPHFANRADFRLMVSEGKLDGTTLTMTRYWSNGLGHAMTTGEALMTAKATMAADAREAAAYHLCICEINLLGDPTLDMRASTPRTVELEAPQQIVTGPQSVTVKAGVAGATVCLSKGDEIYVVGTTDESGVATLEVAPTTPGDMLVTVSGPSLNVVTAVIAVTGS